MARHKVRITDKNGFYCKFDDGSCIGGKYGEPIVLTMCLNEAEFNALFSDDLPHHIAVFNLSQSNVLTTWHKRLICKHFKAFTEQVTIEIL